MVNRTKSPLKNIDPILSKIRDILTKILDSRQKRIENQNNSCHQVVKTEGTDDVDEDVSSGPKLEDEEKKTKTKYYPLPRNWPQETQERFREGPTPKDGHGFIYMYECADPNNKKDRHLWKIGMSMHLVERRIKAQENSNKEKYTVVFQQCTPFRYMTEKVIHLLLNDVREPREHGDGRTEWFWGDKEMLKRQVQDVIKEVKFAFLESRIACPHCNE